MGIGAFDDNGLPPYVPTGPLLSGVSVEFDTWLNGAAEGANDSGQEHVGIDIDGSLSSVAATDLGPAGTLSDAANPNGSEGAIAGVANAAGNVAALMPHPERAIEDFMGSTDGRILLESFVASLEVVPA